MSCSPVERAPSARAVALGLVSICLLAADIRICVASLAAIISPDSALFVDYARRLVTEPLVVMRLYDQHPLYPALILVCYTLVGGAVADDGAGWIFAGRLAAMLGSVGAVLAMYWLASGLYDRRRGLLAAVLIALLLDACQFGGDVLSDMPHLAFYLLGLAALLAGLRGRWPYLLLSAAAGGLAFLVRPEGGSILLVALGLMMAQRSWRWKRRLVLAGGVVAVFFAIAAPYQLAVGKLVPKKSLHELFQFGVAITAHGESPGSDTPAGYGIAANPLPSNASLLAADLPITVDVVRQWIRADRVVYFVLAIVGVLACRPRQRVGLYLLAAAIGLHLVLLHALSASFEYLTPRHALILAAVSLPLAAAGIWWLAARLSERLNRREGHTRVWIAATIVAGCALGTSPWTLRPMNPGEGHLIPCAQWLAANTEAGTLLVGDRRLHRLALYADRPFAEWPWWDSNVKHLARFLEDKPPCYVALDTQRVSGADRNPAFFAELAEQFDARLELVHVEPGPPFTPPTEVRIYRHLK